MYTLPVGALLSLNLQGQWGSFNSRGGEMSRRHGPWYGTFKQRMANILESAHVPRYFDVSWRQAAGLTGIEAL